MIDNTSFILYSDVSCLKPLIQEGKGMVHPKVSEKAWTEFYIGEMVADYSCLKEKNVSERSAIDYHLLQWRNSLKRRPTPLGDAFFIHLAIIGIYPVEDLDEWKNIVGNMVRSINKVLPCDNRDIL